MKEAFKYAFPKTVPIFAGYLFLGLSFGILAVSQGLSPSLTIFMSFLVYSGAMQFAAVPLLIGPFDPITHFFLTLIISARHVFYGITMLKPYSQMDWKKYYTIFAMTDETFSLNVALDIPAHIRQDWVFFHISWLNHLYWILGGVLGVVLGAMIPFDTTGIDFVLTALFLSIFVDQWLSTDDHTPAIIGLLSTFAMLLLFGKQHFMIPSMLLIIMTLLAQRPKDQKGGDIQ